MDNPTVIIPTERLQAAKTLTWKDLHSAQYAFNSPFRLQLADDQSVVAEHVLRLVPKKRLVAFGAWLGKPVVVKIFFDRQHAKRHVQKEIAGIKALQDSKIPTPALYYQGVSQDKRVHILIFERIKDAQTLAEIWQHRISEEASLPLMKSVIIELATQHVLGVVQEDLHLKNFLIAPKNIYTLDGGQITCMPQLLPKKQSINNLALFLAQLGIGIKDYQEKLFQHYAKARGWFLKPEEIDELSVLIKQWNVERWNKFSKKILRASTEYVHIQEANSVGMYTRNYASPAFLKLIKDPEAAFSHPLAEILKAGRSSTVIKIKLGQRDYVIKRYNIKSVAHGLRRCLRPSRAFKSWRLAHKLDLFGVFTAKPVAYIEKRFMGLRSTAYYVTEYVSGDHAGDFFKRNQDQPEKIAQMVKRISVLLKNMAKLEITHGDLKITNLLIDENEHPVFIDLDGAAEHGSLSSLRQAWKKDITRFMKNFHDQPHIFEKFKQELAT